MKETTRAKMVTAAGTSGIVLALALFAKFLYCTITNTAILAVFPAICLLACIVSLTVLLIVATAFLIDAVAPLMH